MTKRRAWLIGAVSTVALAMTVLLSWVLVSCAMALGWRPESSIGDRPSDWAKWLHGSDKLAYTATYTLADNTTVRVAHQPSGNFYPARTYLAPVEHANVAVIAKGGRLVFAFDYTYICDDKSGHAVCRRFPRGDRVGTDYTSLAAFAADVEPGFVPPDLVTNLIVVAQNGGYKLSRSQATISGISCKCARITDLVWRPEPAGLRGPVEFSLCVTETGVLASFAGTWADSRKVSYQLTSLSTNVDAADFGPPSAAEIVEVAGP